MGNLAKSFESRFVIRRGKQAACVKAILGGDAYRRQAKPKLGLFWSARRKLTALFEDADWSPSFAPNGDVIGVSFTGEKLSGLSLFESLAPFVEPGSRVDFWQEYAEGDSDRPNTRWAFDGRKMLWEDMMPAEERAELNRQNALNAAANRENEVRLREGRPMICTQCAIEGTPARELVPVDHPRAVGGVVCYQCPVHEHHRLLVPPRRSA